MAYCECGEYCWRCLFPFRCCGYCPDDFAAPDTAESAQSPQRDNNATLPLFAPISDDKPQRDSAIDDLNIDFSAIEQNPEPVEEPEEDRVAGTSRGGKGGKKRTRALSFR